MQDLYSASETFPFTFTYHVLNVQIMARQEHNVVMKGLTGKVGELLLFKQYRYGTVVSKIPDRSKVVLSEKQKSANRLFKLAVKFAKEVMKDPVKRAECEARLPQGKTVYHTALAEFIAANSIKSEET